MAASNHRWLRKRKRCRTLRIADFAPLSAPPDFRVAVLGTTTKTEGTIVNAIEQAGFKLLYEAMLQALKLKDKRPKPVEAQSLAAQPVADFPSAISTHWLPAGGC